MLKSEGFKKYFFNTSWLFFEHIVRLVVALFVSVYVARYLGPDQYGLLNYSISFVALFSAIATLGLDQIVIRELVKDRNKRDSLLGTAFVLKVSGAVLAIAILAVGVQFTSNDLFTNLLIFIIAAGTLFQSMNVVDFYYQSKVQSKFSVQVKFWTIMGISLLKVYSIYIGAPLLWFAFLVLLENIILASGFFLIYNLKGLSIFSWHFDLDMAKSLLKSSWPLIFSGIFIGIYMKIDQVMLKEMVDTQAVGLYAAAVKLSEAWYFVPTVIMTSFYPAIIEGKKISDEIYYQRLELLYGTVVWLAILIALPITFLGDWVIQILYGIDYVGAASVLKIHIWAAVFVFIGVANSKWLIIENLEKFALYRTMIGALCNVVLNLMLIPKYGIEGAATATVISYFIAAYLSMLFIGPTQKNFWLSTKSFNLYILFKNLLRFLNERKI
ncbi:flippase [Methanohalophilus mahii]|uniref:Polysaccharide biosynthesis protein n=1 Tax=Methanohalophilus mahii (strain ATCC 35705 / DSM 5219 / SLP) TaxID=547558 RepID=D5E8W0_METMS|nr:flippase [Methanohalophilus mahii]ADE35619.1 polysaccharide biosynthesis protein [Methanohalophilus mahii DSM 5219]